MRNKYFSYIFLLLCFCVKLNLSFAQPKCCFYSFKQIETQNPWLKTHNAAALPSMQNIYPLKVGINSTYKNGDFVPMTLPKTEYITQLSSEGYKKLNKVTVFGAFTYQNITQKNTNFYNVDKVSRVYPYILADTIGGDKNKKEVFNLIGAIGGKISDKTNWGLRFEYEVGAAAQDRDPRPLNKTSILAIYPGFLFKTNLFTLGVDLHCQFYNEEIETETIRKNTFYSLFQLHGVGTATYHSAKRYYRLYKQENYGSDLQLSYKSGKIKHLTQTNITKSILNVNDGRMGNEATWSVIKNDSKLSQTSIKISHCAQWGDIDKINRIKANWKVKTSLGTEFLQLPEKIDNTAISHWITYSEEDKYFNEYQEADLAYRRITLNEKGAIAAAFDFSVKYLSFSENYYLPDRNIKYSNLTYYASALKTFCSKIGDFSFLVKLAYHQNIDSKNNIENLSSVDNKITLPNYEYLSSDYFEPGTSLTYEVPFFKKDYKYYLNFDINSRFHDSQNYLTMNFGTGFIF